MMRMMMKVGLPFSLLSIWLSFGSADAMSLKEPQICYILDAVLFIYGIVLTVLYCRMKMRSKQAEKYSGKKDAGEGVYEGLKPHDQDTYETIKMKKGKQ
ncbi:high affinity immunoglobulin epsilon receptor subunit gamma-like isoform X2 [Sinocyclocheilus grahami]|uniref:High affinity immunoglobulin epsilon receptor subunit gamma-like n=1 Tax=Sinocyclocheilus grahami TaxID=75366 RepID=A0A672R8Z2_SINGR|nr:PREDICTED: high affinity immunoglobulin epsilon receptor subunit gamma-like isoform X1 [Sinocyclocheilus grahami]XP_016144586.1 PREDICTED: high affinity immunoglobulin epsilon receptor subunit gamma-like isoform X2 [Sinocyclocheilus grahami]